jgi:hypothetical protein
MNMANIMASVVFGSIGLGVFIYGKKQSNFKALVIGIILMGYPYVVSNAIAVWAIGVVLVAALFILP